LPYFITSLFLISLGSYSLQASTPLPVDDLQLSHTPSAVQLGWSAPQYDNLGNPLIIEHYEIHSAISPWFIPGPDTWLFNSSENLSQVDPEDSASRYYRVIASAEGQPEIDGLLAFYPFNRDASDLGPYEYHGLLQGSATADGALFIGDNDSDRVLLPSDLFDGLTDFSLSTRIWLDDAHLSCPSGFVAGHTLINCGTHELINTLWVLYNPSSHSWIVLMGQQYQLEVFPLPLASWIHFVLIREGQQLRIYFEGGQIAQASAVNSQEIQVDEGGCFLGQDQDIIGGMFESCQSWNGAIDNLRIYNRALSPEEVLQLYLVDQ
jgi:hypothetical protein